MVLQRHLLGAQVLLDSHRIVGATLNSGVVGHDDALTATDPSDSGDDARPGCLIVVHFERGQGRQLQQWTSTVQEMVNTIPG